MVPLWESATWWWLQAPDGVHLSDEVIDWVWLDMSAPDLFLPGTAPGGRAVAPPDWHVMAVRVDFSSGGRHTKTSRQDRCTRTWRLLNLQVPLLASIAAGVRSPDGPVWTLTGKTRLKWN
jgi:hypothetical protein